MKMCFIGYSRANVNLLSVLAVLYYIEACGGKIGMSYIPFNWRKYAWGNNVSLSTF